jgi:hypothetical protein
MAAVTQSTRPLGPAAASRIDAAEPVATSRHEATDLTTTTMDRSRLRSALLQAIVKNEARRNQTGAAPTMEIVSTEGPAISQVEAAQA